MGATLATAVTTSIPSTTAAVEAPTTPAAAAGQEQGQ